MSTRPYAGGTTRLASTSGSGGSPWALRQSAATPTVRGQSRIATPGAVLAYFGKLYDAFS